MEQQNDGALTCFSEYLTFPETRDKLHDIIDELATKYHDDGGYEASWPKTFWLFRDDLGDDSLADWEVEVDREAIPAFHVLVAKRLEKPKKKENKKNMHYFLLRVPKSNQASTNTESLFVANVIRDYLDDHVSTAATQFAADIVWTASRRDGVPAEFWDAAFRVVRQDFAEKLGLRDDRDTETRLADCGDDWHGLMVARLQDRISDLATQLLDRTLISSPDVELSEQVRPVTHLAIALQSISLCAAGTTPFIDSVLLRDDPYKLPSALTYPYVHIVGTDKTSADQAPNTLVACRLRDTGSADKSYADIS